MNDQIFWYTTRSAGILTWATAMASILLGLMLASRVLGRKPGYPWLLDLHRFVSGLSIAFLALHMFTLWADDFVHFGWAELFIPGQSETQTTSVAFGVVAAWILAGIQLSSWLKRFLPTRLWHGLHLGSYAVAAIGTFHAWTAGSDIDNPIVVGVGVVSWVLVLAMTVVRLRALTARGKRAGRLNRLDQIGRVKSGSERALTQTLRDLPVPSRPSDPNGAPPSRKTSDRHARSVPRSVRQ